MWYSEHSWLRVFTPFSWVLGSLTKFRRSRYQSDSKRIWQAPIPVCVVGNITVGGTGKTPLVIWLTEWLTRRGIRVGIVSRGYGGQAAKYPIVVNEQSLCREVGEENILIYRRTKVPVVVDPQRVRATQFLLQECSIDIVVADDGLQHYRLSRNIEIAVIDGLRSIGNGLQLPFGPLREPKERLDEVDWLVSKSELSTLELAASVMDLKPVEFVNLANNSVLATDEFCTEYRRNIRAIAAIGNPKSFQETLDRLEIQAQVEAFRDHHYFREAELVGHETTIIVTEKDAQKICELPIDLQHIWYLKVEVKFKENVDKFLSSLFHKHGLKTTVQN